MLISVLDLTESFEDLNDHVRDIFIVFQSQANYFFCADHVKLIHTALAHLTFQVVNLDLLSLGSFFLRTFFAHAVLAFGELLHDPLQLGVEIGGKISIYLSFHLLVRSIGEQVLLMQHSNLIVDLRDVLKLISVYPFIDGLWAKCSSSSLFTAISIAVVTFLVSQQIYLVKLDIAIILIIGCSCCLMLRIFLATGLCSGSFLLLVALNLLTVHVVTIIMIILMFKDLVVNPLADLTLVVSGLKIIFIFLLVFPHTRIIISSSEAPILVRFESYLLVASMSTTTISLGL